MEQKVFGSRGERGIDHIVGAMDRKRRIGREKQRVVETIDDGVLDDCLELMEIEHETIVGKREVGLDSDRQLIRMAVDIATFARVGRQSVSHFERERFGKAERHRAKERRLFIVELGEDNILRDAERFRSLSMAREVEHKIGHHPFDDRAEAASAEFALDSGIDDSSEGIVVEDKIDVVHFHKSLVLFDQSILRLCKDAQEGIAVERVEVGEHRETADKFGDKAKMFKVGGLDILEHIVVVDLVASLRAIETDNVRLETRSYRAFDTVESPAGDKKDVAGVDLDHFLFGMFASALRGHVDDGAFEEFEESLLDTLATDIASDRRVVALAGYLVNFVDKDDTALSRLDIIVGSLEETDEDIFDIIADIARLGESSSVGDSERHLDKASDSASEERFAGTGLADDDDVALLNFDLIGSLFVIGMQQSLIMIIDSDGEDAFSVVLSDDILVEILLDSLRGGDILKRFGGRLALGSRQIFLEDKVGLFDTRVADASLEAREQQIGVGLGTAAERAETARGVIFFSHSSREKN